jgi:16S rRNA pseudouridine516 synthase
MTSDGEFAHRVISPKSGIDKIYDATVEGCLSPEDVERFREGLVLGDGTECLPAGLTIMSGNRCLVTVQEGKYHQVRRMFAAVGNHVETLKREAIGPVVLDQTLGKGGWRYLTEEEVAALS